MTINETITSTLRSNGHGAYLSYAAPVEAALVERERSIAGNLIEFAVTKGLSATEASAAIEAAGLTLPVPPQVEAAQGGGDDISALKAAVARLTEFAQRHGFRA